MAFTVKGTLEFNAKELGGIESLEINCKCQNTKDVIRQIVNTVNAKVLEHNPDFTRGRAEQVTGHLLGYSDTSAVRYQLGENGKK